ncbi:hypothetical protein B0H66DRAFT_561589 [Apodospora peruviana]|uniref:Uncharacterized protein n=1 Tax=Apodospora peruviana TaxID=516989 RepID=A0AAE0I1H9_9PEZI|nr:hypothetical protein B0H66DRAFT_561589 [Apodospora peruviana]
MGCREMRRPRACWCIASQFQPSAGTGDSVTAEIHDIEKGLDRMENKALAEQRVVLSEEKSANHRCRQYRARQATSYLMSERTSSVEALLCRAASCLSARATAPSRARDLRSTGRREQHGFQESLRRPRSKTSVRQLRSNVLRDENP